MKKTGVKTPKSLSIRKTPTGIHGLDEVTGGGFPTGRTVLVCGSAGCGKTILAMEFLLHGAAEYNEPGLFVSFEESEAELTQNFSALGFDIPELVEKQKLLIDFIKIDRGEIEETGEFDLDGLFIRLDFAIRSIKAKRVVLDTIETLFGGFPNQTIIRAELVRLFRWLKDRGVTAVITGERGEGSLTRHGLEEYVSDCVILLDHRVDEQLSTRRLRIVKYRGTSHGTNEYPFVIDRNGVGVLPVTSMGLAHKTLRERVPSGVQGLDEMLTGGFFRGSSVLVSGTAGTGKSSLAAFFADAACRRGEKCLYFAFEESPDQICRNMSSVGLNLKRWIDKGLLQIHAARPTLSGLEQHLVTMHRIIKDFEPSAMVTDPVSNLVGAGSAQQATSMLLRLVDYLKERSITAFFTTLTHGGERLEATNLLISSLMDTWILLRDIEIGGERNRGIYVLKSRGMNHSNQIREYTLSGKGIDLIDVYTGPEGVLTGSARLAQEAQAEMRTLQRRQESERRRRELERKRKALEAQIAALKAEFESESFEAGLLATEAEDCEARIRDDIRKMGKSRKSDLAKGERPSQDEPTKGRK